MKLTNILSFHFHKGEKTFGPPIRLRSGLNNLKNRQSAFFGIAQGETDITMHFDDVEIIERMATELSTLAMQIRVEGWHGEKLQMEGETE